MKNLSSRDEQLPERLLLQSKLHGDELLRHALQHVAEFLLRGGLVRCVDTPDLLLHSVGRHVEVW